MDIIDIQLPDNRTSHIYIGESLANIQQYTGNRCIVIITEANIYKLYKLQFPTDTPVILIDGGEENKTLSTVEKITEQLIELGIDRESFIVGIGGGIVCDITGFVASIYMRGLRFGFVATTLLAQVDASVGGKNGVNFSKYKNMLGVFNQPDFVICEIDMLKTLPALEFRAGLAEVVKTALIADKELFEYLEKNIDNILRLDQSAINYIVKRCIEIKASVVQSDEREAGERRKLNLGHTFGHAIEKHSNLLHGEAVSIGLVIAAQLSQNLGLITEDEVLQIKKLLSVIGLPVQTDINKDLLLEAVTKDKKKHNQSIHFVLIKTIGNAEVKSIPFEDLNNIFNKD